MVAPGDAYINGEPVEVLLAGLVGRVSRSVSKLSCFSLSLVGILYSRTF